MKNLAAVLVLVLSLLVQQGSAQLSTTFYSRTCPNAANIVRDAMSKKFRAQPVSAAGLLRIFFHDAMVEGLDASVLIGSTPGNKAEKDFEDNLSLPGDGFDAVFKAKAALDAQCPGVVSCSDALVLATKELLVQMGGPSWNVKLGRRDGRTSKASSVQGNLPGADMTVDQLIRFFGNRGFSTREMVVLSGGHSAGFAHCNKFMDRIYNFKGTRARDPTMNFGYAESLKGTCPTRGLDPTVVANLDTTTPTRFDNVFYQNLENRKGLLSSDQALFEDRRTRPIVQELARDRNKFFFEFASAMDKLSQINVKTGRNGEIRRDCGRVN